MHNYWESRHIICHAQRIYKCGENAIKRREISEKAILNDPNIFPYPLQKNLYPDPSGCSELPLSVCQPTSDTHAHREYKCGKNAIKRC